MQNNCWLVAENNLEKKIQNSSQKYRTPSKLQKEIKKNYCCFNPIWHGGWGRGMEGGFLAPTISYTVIKKFLIGLASSALFYFHKIYFYTFWPNLDKFFAEGHEIWPICVEES